MPKQEYQVFDFQNYLAELQPPSHEKQQDLVVQAREQQLIQFKRLFISLLCRIKQRSEAADTRHKIDI